MSVVSVVLWSVLQAAPAPKWESVSIPTPHVHQEPDFCGEADVEMELRRRGVSLTQDDVFALSGLDPAKGRGVWTDELAQTLRTLGFDPGPTWYRVTPANAAAEISARFSELHADLLAGQPSIVCMHYDGSPSTTEHFRLITGYDAKSDEVIYQEPAEPSGANARMKRETFFALWPFKPAKDRWSLIRLRLTPVKLADTPRPAESAPTQAQAAQHVMELKKTLPAGFTVVWEKPFLVIGNEAPATVKKQARDMVRWTTNLLVKDFFDEAPAQLQEVWIFKDKPSYEHASRELFHTEPDTPYGYYLASRRALVMNIKPGYGTLVHELVHPFMHHAWPDAPSWLNEGLASLFEFPYEEGGHLKGRVNWRLPGLKAALRDARAPSFFTLVHTDTNAFYDDPYGVHYAEARYLCHWLQEKGLLVKFVRRAQALKAADPTGWQALQEVLGADPDSFRHEWERYVMSLGNRT